MKRTLIGCVCLAVWFVPCSTIAEKTKEVTLEPIVVTATRVAVPSESVGKAVTVITADQIEAQQATSLTDVLQNVPGLLVVQQRRPGGLALIKIRGLDSEYTQILIDGLPVRDPSDPQGTAIEFMDDMLVENIERIEIVRGSSSTLYGSDSVGGTINIITKKGTATPELFASFEGGSMSTYQEVLGARGASGLFNYALTGKRIDSAGLDDHDDYNETVVAGQFGLAFAESGSLMAQMKYSTSERDLNDSPGILNGVMIKDQDDPDDRKAKTLWSGGIVLTQDVSEALDYSVKFGYVKTDRKFTFGPEGDEFGFGAEATYAGNTMNAEFQVNYSLTDAHLLTVGYEYETEEFEQKLGERTDTPDSTRHAVYVQDSMALMADTLNITPGVRYMHHDQVGGRFDWEVSASYLTGDSGTRLHGHIGTGFRAPSLYELYGASFFGDTLYEFGNNDLEPEESLGWNVGMELKGADDKARLDVTYFRNTFDKIIGFGAGGYENIEGGKSSGVEIETSYTLTDATAVSWSYTYTKTEDANGDRFFGVPKHSISTTFSYRLWHNWAANLSVIFKGKEDIPLFDATTFTSERYENDGYKKVDFALKYDASQKFNLWGRVENLLDADYNANGYKAPGRSFYGGIKLML